MDEASDRNASNGHWVVAGASGVVGTHLLAHLQGTAQAITVLTRNPDRYDGPKAATPIEWHPAAMADGDESALAALAETLDGADVVVNLAGSSLDEGRLDAKHKQRVRDSRVQATETLVATAARAARPPQVWLQASGVNSYGDGGDRELTEADPTGNGFLAEVCQAWEAAAARVHEMVDPPPRLAVVRIGLVLAKDAPAWKKMLVPIRMGAGGPLGSGRQWYAWIDADDLARILIWLAGQGDAEGVYNAVAPEPVRQVDLAKRAARRLKRPAFMPAPKFALKAALGNVADELLLPSCRARPARLLESGFAFECPDIETELDRLLG